MNNDCVGKRKSVFEADSSLFGDFINSLFANDVALTSNSRCGNWLVTSNHHNLDSCGLTLQHGVRHTVAWWVDERDDTDEALFAKWEVWLVHIEAEPRSVLFPWKMQFSKPKHSLASLTKAVVGFSEPFVPAFIFRNWHPVLEHMGAELPDLFGSALGEHAEVAILSLIMIDAERIFVNGVEGETSFTIFFILRARELFAGFNNVVDGLEEFDKGRLGSITSCRHVEIEHTLQ